VPSKRSWWCRIAGTASSRKPSRSMIRAPSSAWRCMSAHSSASSEAGFSRIASGIPSLPMSWKSAAWPRRSSSACESPSSQPIASASCCTRRERERADVEEHVPEAEAPGAPLDGGDRHRERQGDARPEEGGAGERADGADGDRADVGLERERLAQADEADDGQQAEDVVVPTDEQAGDAGPHPER